MSSKTKIVVLRMKEIIYTAIFIGFGILLLLLLVIMFRPQKTDSGAPASSQPLYIPGIYSSSVSLGSQEVNLEVAVDAGRICSITMVPLSDSVAVMFPLAEPSLKALSDQICATQSLENLSYPQESRYTSQVLLQAIQRALDKAAVR